MNSVEFKYLIEIYLLVWLGFALRYGLVTTFFFWKTDGRFAKTWGRQVRLSPSMKTPPKIIRLEIFRSLMATMVFSGVVTLIWATPLGDWSLLYRNFNDYSVLWFLCSLVVYLFLHDMLFYLLHRVLHHRWIFRWSHRAHHESRHPSPFAAYSFSLAESLAEVTIAVIPFFLIPLHPVAFFLTQTVSMAYNAYGHSMREFYPKNAPIHPIWKWFNTATLHSAHHAMGRGNYGLYLTIWDRWFGTYQPSREYEA